MFEDQISKIDFGDIDGLYDANLKHYFLDENYWDNIISQLPPAKPGACNV